MIEQMNDWYSVPMQGSSLDDEMNDSFAVTTPGSGFH
jgi:hypothetical protein